MTTGFAQRLATTHLALEAMEHPTEKALKNYLKEHPNADPKKHTIKNEGDDEVPVHVEDDEPKKKSLWDRAKSFGAKAKSFLQSAPKETKRFFEDDAFRRKTLMDVHAKLEAAPKAMMDQVVHTVKEEVHEYKEAAHGVAAVLKGGKMDDHQKKALKTVATHMAIGLTAAALSASGPLAVAGTFGKGLAKHVAMKAVHNAMGNLHVLEELGHIGHGVHHVVKHFMDHMAAEDKGKDPKDMNPDEVMSAWVSAAIAKEIKGLKDDDLEEVLKGMDKEGKEASFVTTLTRKLVAQHLVDSDALMALRFADVTIDVAEAAEFVVRTTKDLVQLREDMGAKRQAGTLVMDDLNTLLRPIYAMLRTTEMHELAYGLLQKYKLQKPQQTLVKTMITLTSKGLRPSGRDFLALTTKVFDLADTVLDFVKMADELVLHDKGVLFETPTDEGSGSGDVLKAGSFEVVNTGGFKSNVMTDAAKAITEADRMLHAAGLGKVCYGKVFITQQLQGKSSGGIVLAFYDRRQDDLYVRANAKGVSLVQSALHELGHRFVNKFMKDPKQMRTVYYAISGSGTDTLPAPPEGDVVVFKNKQYTATKVIPSRQEVSFVLADGRTGWMDFANWYQAKGVNPTTLVPDYKGFVTPYARVGGPEENFAEMFAFYVMGDLPPSQKALFEPLLQ